MSDSPTEPHWEPDPEYASDPEPAERSKAERGKIDLAQRRGGRGAFRGAGGSGDSGSGSGAGGGGGGGGRGRFRGGKRQPPNGAPKGPLPTDPVELIGATERVTFHNEENGYSVIRFMPEDHPNDDPITCVGTLTAPAEGEMLRIVGRWEETERFGRQLRIEEAKPYVPTTLDGLTRFLGSGFVKGIGPKTAERIVEKFGEDTIRVLDQEPHRLVSVHGISRKMVARLTEEWSAKRHMTDAIAFLQEHGLTPRLANKVFRLYGDRTIELVKSNPYRLARDVERVGFTKADGIARTLGFPHDAEERAEAGVLYLLSRATDDGHCFLPWDKLQEEGAELLGVDQAVVQHAVRQLHESGYVICESVRDVVGEEQQAVYTATIHAEEVEAARLLHDLRRAPKMLPRIDAPKAIAGFEAATKFSLAPMQRAAVETALTTGVVVMTGGPGTGKTTIVRAILRIVEDHGAHVLLAAPTGRAAKRLSESSRHPAKTIHRLLGFDASNGRFLHDEQNPLKTDLLIIDETSMLDIGLAAKLLRAVPSSCSVLFVGDVDQLPPVGPGEFLRDVIDSGLVKTVRLDEVFRQDRRSLIVKNAHRINQGEFPFLNDGEDAKKSDFYFIERDDPEELRAALVKLVTERIPRTFGLDPLEDVQVLVPMHRNSIGGAAINELLQEALNREHEPEYLRAGFAVREGDKLMQVRNNYDLDVYNGDIGRVVMIDRRNKLLHLDFEGRKKAYPFEDLDQLTLAYAITVHKSQGSEYRAVIIVLHTQHFIMLRRNLIYTALTRARDLAIILGSKKALATALRTVDARTRHTALAWRLREAGD